MLRLPYPPCETPIRLALPRFQDDPSALAHFKVIVRIDEDRLLECGFADFAITNPGEEFVAAIGAHDFVAEVLHNPDASA